MLLFFERKIMQQYLALGMLASLKGYVIFGEAVSLFYCNSSYLTPIGSGMADGMYLFDSVQTYNFIQARDACKAWPYPSGFRNVTFLAGDILNTIPTVVKPSLASLWNPTNFNLWLSFLTTTSNDYWVGVGQDINVTTCPSSAIAGVYENSWNWTWVDGTPMLRDTKGQGLVFFGLGEPYNSGGNEHYGSSYLDNLNDVPCSNVFRAVCSLPRKCLNCMLC
jgi:hypothetical protein